LFDFERDFCLNPSGRIVEQQGQERTVEQRRRDVYETHRHRTFAVAFYMTGNEIEAEEVLTDTFVRAFEQQVEPNGQQVDTAMVTELRDRLPIDEVVEPLPSAGTLGLGGRNIKRTELEEALKELPPNERLTFLLRDVEGYSPEKVAELLEVPRQQIERTLLAARIRLRTVLAANANPNAQAA
jgi:RNA polymerase sigma-70 factor (ECF subfamily)